jgi:hypothetical protein
VKEVALGFKMTDFKFQYCVKTIVPASVKAVHMFAMARKTYIAEKRCFTACMIDGYENGRLNAILEYEQRE